MVIIIDDLGHQLANGRAAVDLPGRVNYAILPYTPYGKRLARQAYREGKEVLLHAPMSNLGLKPLGRGALTPDLSRAEFDATLAAALEQVPHARGVNNHMGSDLTRRRTQMEWLMQQLARRGLYFVDSRTEAGTVAATVASEQRVPNLSRQVFLDNERSPAAIAERFGHLQRLAREEGLAVAIGHPYPETLAFLHEALPKLVRQGYRLATVSEVLERRAPAPAAIAEGTQYAQ
nr:divergent polysaccharide deacetylase family protein [Parahaliea mediterranea]